MEDDLTPSHPLEYTILCIQHRPNKETRVLEPWPIATITIDQAGGVVFTGRASKAFGPLQQALEAALREFAARGTQQFVQKLTDQINAQL